MHDIIEADECVAVAWIDSVKVQFDVSDLMLVQGSKASVLQARLPRELFRFQRRNLFRVPHAPKAHRADGDLPPSVHPRHAPRAACST